jgi:hypothetical protein
MRRGNLVIGSVIILVGVLLLINQFAPGLQLLKYIFPLVLILLGIWLLLGRHLLTRPVEEELFSVPLEGARSADIFMHHGAGRLTVRSYDAAGQLLSGTFIGGVDHKVDRFGDRLRINLRTPPNMWFGFPGIYARGFNWSLGLSRDIDLNLDLQGGADEVEMDLTDLRVSKLTVKTGASSTLLTLPDSAGFTAVKIEAGAAKVAIRIPRGVAGRIRTKDSGVSAITVDTTRFTVSDEGYRSPDYDSATNKADIVISTGVGSVEIS